MKNKFTKILAYLAAAVAVIFIFYLVLGNKSGVNVGGGYPAAQDQNSKILPSASSVPPSPAVRGLSAGPKKNVITEPIAGAIERITKKPFGIKVSPSSSPVSPEKFSGYHTGVDFETTVGEQDADIPVYAICAGPLLIKKIASGYGGVAVQKCQIAGEIATVVYGHVRLASIESAVSGEILAGQKIGVLGKGYSAETGGERKHLHLGIHKGAVVNIRGYAQSQPELGAWIDAAEYL